MSDGQVKREVVIELLLKPAEGNKAAAQAAKQQVEAAVKAATDAQQKGAAAQQAIDDRVFKNRARLLARIGDEQRKMERQAVAEAERSARRATETAEREAKKRADMEMRMARLAFSSRMKYLAQQEAAEKKAQATAERAVAQRAAAQTKVATSSAQALSSVTELARGFALLGIVGEEDTQKILQMFVQIEAGVSIVRGLVGTWKNVTDAVKAANVVTAANIVLNRLAGRASAGNAAGSAAQSIAGAAGGGGRLAGMFGRLVGMGGAAAGGSAALGGGGAAAAGAAGGGGAAAAGGVAAGGGALAGAGLLAAGAAAGLVLFESVNLLRRAFGDTSASSESFVGALISWRKAAKDAEESTQALEKSEERRSQQLKDAAERDQKIVDASGLARDRASALESIAARRDGASGMSEVDQARAARLRGASAADQAAGGVAAAEARNRDRQSKGVKFSFADEIEGVKTLQGAQEQVAAAAEQEFQAVQRITQERQRAADAAQNELEKARELVKAEEERSQSALARFGRLSKGEQKRAQAIADKVQGGGTLTKSEAQFLESSGIGGKKAEGFFADQGKAAGGEAVLGALGDLDELNAAREAERQAIENVATANQAVIDSKNQEVEAAGRLNTALDALVDTVGKLTSLLGQQGGLQNNPQLGGGAPAGGGGVPGAPVAALGNSIDDMARAADQAARAGARRLNRTEAAIATQRV